MGPNGSGLDRVTRRGFLKQASTVALVSYTSLAGVGHGMRQALAAARSPIRCAQWCRLLECRGCACGGDYFHCVGCGEDMKVCITRQNCTSFCLIPAC